ncbi:hypothetical protein DPEC_G00179630 [Dallia pectoralis]|uniref:Uncharacterized protein n=1 Tax=Dallia pectoralis TaxID=75939 RepID=A0ACC2GFD3_DALPE|nr:hypothetical protein DPEC_G00179630 [Dallia pectoralis]
MNGFTVQVFIRLLFNLNTPVPNEDVVLVIVNKQLFNQLRAVPDLTQASLVNVTYFKLNNTAFAIDFGFQITNFTLMALSESSPFTNETYSQIQVIINSLLLQIVSKLNVKVLTFSSADFTVVGNLLKAQVTYGYKDGDKDFPTDFIQDILKLAGLLTTTAAPTTTTSTTLLPSLLLSTFYSTTSGGGFPGWALAIIIPCGIAIILIPLWILLACLICGCCAGIRRRWHRRRSYNVQYTSRNGLF